MDGSGKRAVVQRSARAQHDGSPPEERMHDAQAAGPADGPRRVGSAVVELMLLLPYQQLDALESAAIRQEMTVGQLLRRLIRDGLAGMDDAQTPEDPTLPDAEADASNAGFVWSDADGGC